MLFLSERHLTIFDFCSQVNAYINQQFALRRAKWSSSIEKLSDFALGQHTITMEQARRLRVLVQDIQVEKMTILALVGAKPLESNVDMLLVSIDGLSHTVICPCQWTNETGQICYHGLAAIYHTTSAWTEQMSTHDPMWYSLPYRVTTLQKVYGPIPVLPTTDRMDATLVFPERHHRKRGARKKSRYKSDSTKGAPKYNCRLCGEKCHYASNCGKPQVSSVIMEYEKGASKYLHGLHVVKVVNDGSLL